MAAQKVLFGAPVALTGQEVMVPFFPLFPTLFFKKDYEYNVDNPTLEVVRVASSCHMAMDKK